MWVTVCRRGVVCGSGDVATMVQNMITFPHTRPRQRRPPKTRNAKPCSAHCLQLVAQTVVFVPEVLQSRIFENAPSTDLLVRSQKARFFRSQGPIFRSCVSYFLGNFGCSNVLVRMSFPLLSLVLWDGFLS